MIKIENHYNWYNVYVDNTLVLTKVKDVSGIIDALHKTNTPYNLDFRSFV